MINPIELKGNWTEGFALDVHVIESIYRRKWIWSSGIWHNKKWNINLLLIDDLYRIKVILWKFL